MKYLQLATFVLIIVLAVSLEYTYTSLSSENQRLNSEFAALNQSYFDLNISYNYLRQNYYNSLSNFLELTNSSAANTAIPPPISESEALLFALNDYVNIYGGGNITCLEGNEISIELYNLTIYTFGDQPTYYKQLVTEPVSNYSAVTIFNSTYPGIYTTYYYAWEILVQSPSCYPQGSTQVCAIDNYPAYYWIDASTGEVIPTYLFY
jgi:hypothetical protein